MEIIRTLTQTRLLEHGEYTLTTDTLVVRQKFRAVHSERTIRLEELDLRPKVQPGPIFGGYTVWGLLLVMGVVLPSLATAFYWLGVLVGAVATYMAYLLSRGLGTQLLLETKQDPVVLYRKRPTPQAVDEFVAAVQAQARVYLRWKYGQVDPGYPAEIQVKNFRWLRDQNHITEAEYAALKADLFGTTETRPAG
jgi:hypothetical protein